MFHKFTNVNGYPLGALVHTSAIGYMRYCQLESTPELVDLWAVVGGYHFTLW